MNTCKLSCTLLITAVYMLYTTVANAEKVEQISVNKYHEAYISNDVNLQQFENNSSSHSAKEFPEIKRISDATAISKSYVEFDLAYKSDSFMHGTGAVIIKGNASGEIEVDNFFFHGANKITGTLYGDSIYFPAQTLMTVSEKPLTLCRYIPETNKFAIKDGVSAKVNNDGSISLGPWCGVIINDAGGASIATNGNSISICTSTLLKPTNATILNINAKDNSKEKFDILIEQKFENTLTIYNFIDNGASIDAYVNADKSIEISPQPLFVNTQYGTFLCYAADWKTGVRLKGNIPCTSTESEINIGNWGVFSQLYSQVVSAAYLSSKISINSSFSIKYPSTLELTWNGTGTQIDPFLISSPRDLSAFSEAVANGNDFKDKYVQLASDIDASQLPLAFRPIGRSVDKPFNGIFDGAAHSIHKLKIESGTIGNTGLFGYLGKNGSISNFTLDQPQIISYGEKTGCVVGEAYGNISNISVKGGSLTHFSIYGGGIAGYIKDITLENCNFEGDIIIGGASGGIFGIAYGTANIRKCDVNATIQYPRQINQLYRAIGGVGGYIIGNTDAAPSVEDCVFAGTLKDIAGKAHTGGIIGDINEGALRRSFSIGALLSNMTDANGSFGGLVGLMNTATVSQCYASNQMVCNYNNIRTGGLIGNILAPVRSDGTPSKVEQCYFTGQLLRPYNTPTQAIYGACEPKPEETFFSVCYDNQINPYDADTFVAVSALATSGMTRSTGITGFDATVWNFSKGSYPVLKVHKDKQTSVLSAAPITLDKGQDVSKVKSDFTISTKGGVDWFVSTSSGLQKESTALSINSDYVSVKPVSARENLFAQLGDYWKCYSITTLNPSGFVGDGSESNPYLIRNINDLLELDKSISVYGLTFAGDYFLQTNDIDLAYTTAFKGIGSAATVATAFNGIYDGGGYKIKRMKIEGVSFNSDGFAQNPGSRPLCAFITYADKKSVIKNVTLDSDCSIKGYDNVAGIVGYTRGIVENCRNYAPITALGSYASGIAILVATEGSVTNCYNEGTITSATNTAAGIACNVAGSVSLCQNNGEVRVIKLPESSLPETAQHTAAGIVCNLNDNAHLDNNINAGYVHGLRDIAGIFTYATPKAFFSDNINYGTVHYTYTNGSCGAVSANTSANIPGSANNIYDAQTAHFGAVNLQPANYAVGVTTSKLISGTPLFEKNKDAYSWEANRYPVLKNFANDRMSKILRDIHILMPEQENAYLFRTQAVVSDSVQWSISSQSNYFSVGNGIFKFNSPNELDSTQYAVLIAQKEECTKPFFIRVLPLNFAGEGTENNPYTISSASDLIKISTISNKDGYDFAGVHFRQTNDINLKESGEFMPICSGPYPFNGEYDGQNHSIKNITINTPEDDYAALFCKGGATSFIHNLTLTNGSITGKRYVGGFIGLFSGHADNLVFQSKVSTISYPYAGGIVGIAGAGALIENCSNKGEIAPAAGQGAGIAYYLKKGATIRNCSNDAEIKCSPGAGIAITSDGVIADCINNAPIAGTSALGGILATNGSGDSILRCINNAPITGSGTGIGGIVGYSSPDTTSYISNCKNFGNLQGESSIGGIIGFINKAPTLTDCENKGEVIASGSYSGGIIGYASGIFSDPDVYIANCYNYATVAAMEYGGGLAGYAGAHYNFKNCFNTGSVILNKTFAGGLVGYSRNANFFGCGNVGEVYAADGAAAGIAAVITSGIIQQCANFGSVASDCNIADRCNAAGIAAQNSAKIIGSYNMGSISAPTHAAGLVGYIDAVNVSISNTYNAGNIDCSGVAAAAVLSSRFDVPSISNVYYLDKSFSGTPSELDKYAASKSETDFINMKNMGDDFVYRDFTWPTAASLATNQIANFHAASMGFTNGDNASSVSNTITIPSLDSIVWSNSEHFRFNDGKFLPIALGDGWIKKSVSAFDIDLEYKFKLRIVEAPYSGIDDFENRTSITNTKWFEIDGTEVKFPIKGKPYIKVQVFKTGKSISSKSIFK